MVCCPTDFSHWGSCLGQIDCPCHLVLDPWYESCLDLLIIIFRNLIAFKLIFLLKNNFNLHLIQFCQKFNYYKDWLFNMKWHILTKITAEYAQVPSSAVRHFKLRLSYSNHSKKLFPHLMSTLQKLRRDWMARSRMKIQTRASAHPSSLTEISYSRFFVINDKFSDCGLNPCLKSQTI